MVANGCPFTVTAMLPPTVRVAVSTVTVPLARTVSPPLVRLKSVVMATDAAPDTLAVSLMCTPCAATSTVVCTVNAVRSEEHTSELQSHSDLVCRLLLEKKNNHDA